MNDNDEDDNVFVGPAWAIPISLCLTLLFGWCAL